MRLSVMLQVLTTALETAGKIVVGAATSSSVKGMVSNVADKARYAY